MDNYFVNESPDQLMSSLNAKIDDYYNSLRNKGRLYLWRNSYTQIFKPKFSGGRVRKVGDELEFKQLDINHYANIIQHQVTNVTQNRIEFDAIAANSDISSQAQARFSVRLLDSEIKNKNINQLWDKCVRYACTYDEGFMHLYWDYLSGVDFLSTQNELGQPIVKKSGDVKIKVYHPIDTIRDCTVSQYEESDWVVLRTRINRYDVVAEYPNLKDKILSVPKGTLTNRDELVIGNELETAFKGEWVYQYEFYHKRTPSVPNGMYIKFVGSDVILEMTELTYPEIPIIRVYGQNDQQVPHGWTSNYDLLSIQDAINKLYSIITSNQLKFGNGIILAPKGGGYSASMLKGMRLVEYDPRLGELKSLNLTQTPGEIFSFLAKLESIMEKLASVSGTMRGDPAANIRSGNMLDTIIAQNTHFLQGLEKSYNFALEQFGTMFIKILRQYADAERPAAIMGINGQYYTKYFKSTDLQNVERIYIQVGNPAQKQFSGRLAIARDLLNSSALKDPREYFQILNTGNLDTATDPDNLDFMLIQEENEMIMQGMMVPTSPTDYIAAHGYHHCVVGTNPAIRQNPMIFQNLIQHIGSHAMDAGFMIPEPQLNIDGMPMVDMAGMPIMTQVPDIVGFINWCRMIMNAPPSGAFQMAQAAMAQGIPMAPPAQKMQTPNSQPKGEV